SLQKYVGRTVKIALRTDGGGPGVASVRAGFGRPLVVRTEVRPRRRIDATGAAKAAPTESAELAPDRPMNVVLLVIGSLRADHLGCYGYGRPTSPNLDRIATESVVYEQAFAASSWTWPSIASLLTGLYPPTHGVAHVDRCFLSDSLLTLAEQLQAADFTTLGCSADPLISHTKNFQQGFEIWREFPSRDATRITDEFADWVHRYRNYQFFAYVHFADPRRPFNPPESW